MALTRRVSFPIHQSAGERCVASLKELIELQRLDTEIHSKRRRLAEIEALMNDNQELRKAKAVVERTDVQFRDLEAEQKSGEWDVQQTGDRIAQVEQRLMGNQVTNPREFEMLQREIGNLRKRQNDLEEIALAAMEKVERARPIVETRRNSAATLEDQWNTAQSDLVKERKELEEALPVLEQARGDVDAAVPAALRQTYNRIASKRGGVGVSKLNGSSCSECRVSLPSQHVQRARAGHELVTCNNCGRILYP
jgi:predicted  nucleic acid-binding Zn-ribbon protein